MTNSFGVNVTNRTASASGGQFATTGTLFLSAVLATGPTTSPVQIQGIAELEAALSTGRTGEYIPLWDYLDFSFREGLNNCYLISAAESGDLAAALAKFDKRLGPGQVATLGAEPSVAYPLVLAHVNENNRIGLLDGKKTDITKGAWIIEGDEAADLSNAERVGVFGSWYTGPGPVGVSGAEPREVPASAIIAALCQRVDETGNPNTPAGGEDFPLNYASGLLYDPNDTERGELFAEQANMGSLQYGRLINYGFVSAVPESTTTPFWQLNCSRARMWLQAEAERIGRKYYMKDIDGQGKLAARFKGELEAPCKRLYEAGGLYGITPGEAFNVNVGVTVNTETSVAEGKLNAVLEAKFSLASKTVNIDLVSVPVTGVVQ